MHVEILTFDGCPHRRLACDLVQQALVLECADATIDLVDVETIEAAMRLRFLGSPSVRINGMDVEAASRTRTDYGLMCRTYASGKERIGAPSLTMLRTSIRQILEGSSV